MTIFHLVQTLRKLKFLFVSLMLCCYSKLETVLQIKRFKKKIILSVGSKKIWLFILRFNEEQLGKNPRGSNFL